MTIAQLSFYRKDWMQAEPYIPMVGDFVKDPPNVGVGLYPSLMGTFSMHPLEVNMISHVYNEPSAVEVPFKTSNLSNLWNFPNLNNETSIGMAMPTLFAVEVAYK